MKEVNTSLQCDPAAGSFQLATCYWLRTSLSCQLTGLSWTWLHLAKSDPWIMLHFESLHVGACWRHMVVKVMFPSLWPFTVLPLDYAVAFITFILNVDVNSNWSLSVLSWLSAIASRMKRGEGICDSKQFKVPASTIMKTKVKMRWRHGQQVMAVSAKTAAKGISQKPHSLLPHCFPTSTIKSYQHPEVCACVCGRDVGMTTIVIRLRWPHVERAVWKKHVKRLGCCLCIHNIFHVKTQETGCLTWGKITHWLGNME